jgi:hypothetical protein
LTRFIPPEVARRFEATGPDAAADVGASALPAVPPVDVAARVRSLWG